MTLEVFCLPQEHEIVHACNAQLWRKIISRSCKFYINGLTVLLLNKCSGKAAPYPRSGGGPTIRRGPTMYIVLVC